MSEYASAMTLGTLRYAQVWEDHRLLEQALRIGPDDDVLCIASAGCNVLALLRQGPRRIVAVDVNPAQTALLELKLAALEQLGPEELAALVGVRDGPARLACYERVRSRLSDAARAFWDARAGDLAAGIVHSGRLERYFADFHRELSAVADPSAIAALLDLDDPDEQRSRFDAVLGTPAVAAAFVSYFGRERMAAEGRDPAQFRWVADNLDVGWHFWERFRWACTELPLRDNFYLEFFLTARYRDLHRGPPYLRPAAFDRLRARRARVAVVTADIEEVLAAERRPRFTKAALSDMFEYVSPGGTEAIFEALVRALRPGARIAYWNLLVPRSSPERLRARLVPLTRLSESLWRRDRSWFYRAFHVEEVLARRPG